MVRCDCTEEAGMGHKMIEKTRKRIAIRADGNSSLGMGHLMRCLSIAKAAGKKAECVFLVSENEAGNFIKEKGFNCHVLGTDYRQMNEELPLVEELYRKYEFSLLLVDSYQCTQEYLDAWLQYCPVYRMDDTGESHLQSTGLINYNIYAKELNYPVWVKENMQLVLGAEYAPVKEPFLQTTYVVREQAKRIMITMGGSDTLNIAGNLCEKLLQTLDKQEEFIIICGRFNPYMEKLLQLQRQEARVKVLVDVPDMWNRMAEADIVISAAGSTMYELSAMGVPAVCCYYVENQRRIAEGFARNVGIENAGNYAESADEVLNTIVREVCQLMESYEKRLRLSKQMKMVTDGRGAERIVNKLLGNEIKQASN